jgi:hypothetical protein
MKYTSITLACAGLLAAATIVNAAEAKKAEAAEPQITLTSGFDFVTVDGDNAQYRADHWMTDGWSGGIEDLNWKRELAKGWTMDLEARAIFGNDDYKVKLELAKPDFGFVRVGFKQFTKYYQSTGGYFPYVSGPGSFDLAFNPSLDIGNFTVDFGLTLPNLPQVTVGYERQYKNGTKSLTEWGSVFGSIDSSYPSVGVQTRARKIYPAWKDIDEYADIFKLSLEHDVKKVHLSDDFRYEHFKGDTYRFLALNVSNTVGVVNQYEWYKESTVQDTLYNAFRAESQMTKNLYGAFGYMYNSIDAGSAMSMDYVPRTGSWRAYYTRDVSLEQGSHVLSGSLYYTPHSTFSVYGGMQYEDTQEDKYLDGDLWRSTGHRDITNNINIHLTSLEGNLGARFTGIPNVTLYSEGRWQQQSIAQDSYGTDRGTPFVTSEPADVHRTWVTAGMSCAPFQKTTLTAQYRYTARENESPENALITWQEFTTHEFSTKLTIRPCAKVSTTFRYQLLASEINGSLEGDPQEETADFYQNIYSVNVTVTPINRLYLSGLFSYQTVRSESLRNPATSVPLNPTMIVLPSKGDVWTVNGSAGLALDEKTDLTASYTFTMSDNYADNASYGLPLGNDWEQHEVGVSLSRKLRDNVTVQVRYAYSEYQSDADAGVNDYRAHQFGASCTIRF